MKGDMSVFQVWGRWMDVHLLSSKALSAAAVHSPLRNFQLSLMVWVWRWAWTGGRTNKDIITAAIQWQAFCGSVFFSLSMVICYK